MNIRGAANSITRRINPNIDVVVKISSGYTIDPLTRRQIPAYTNTPAKANIQALDGKDLKQLDGLNISGTIRAAYLYGSVSSVVRPDEKGGDVIIFDNKEWLVVKVLETWSTWCKVAIAYQGASS